MHHMFHIDGSKHDWVVPDLRMAHAIRDGKGGTK